MSFNRMCAFDKHVNSGDQTAPGPITCEIMGRTNGKEKICYIRRSTFSSFLSIVTCTQYTVPDSEIFSFQIQVTPQDRESRWDNKLEGLLR
jgi:hypothetical protein